MKKGRKGQAAFEYMLIAGVIGIMVLPAAYLFYKYSISSADEIDNAQLDKLGREIASTAEKVYYQGPPSRTELEGRMPKNVRNISIVGDWNSRAQQLLIRAKSGDSVADFSYPTSVNINGSFNGSLYEVTVGAGIKKITIEAYQTPPSSDGSTTTFAHINFGGRCPVSVVYDFNTNGGYDGEDSTFFSNCCANAAGFPKYRPSQTWQRGWFDNTGFAGENPYAVCMNADYNRDCAVNNADWLNFCTTTGLPCVPAPC